MSDTIILVLTGCGICMFGMIAGAAVSWINIKRWSK